MARSSAAFCLSSPRSGTVSDRWRGLARGRAAQRRLAGMRELDRRRGNGRARAVLKWQTEEDLRQMLCRDRHRIGRAGDLRDEAAVLAERIGKPLAHARRPLVDHRRQDRSCRRGSPPRHRWRSASSAIGHRSDRRRPAIAALAMASCAGATERSRRPASSSAGMAAGSPPASPHRLTGDAVRAAECRDLRAISRSTAGLLHRIQMPRPRRCRAPPPSHIA